MAGSKPPTAPKSATRWCIYALGGGLGHVSRAVALARAATARGHEILLLVNSRLAAPLPIVAELGNGGQLAQLSSKATPEQTATEVRRLIRDDAPDVFVVDTFPRGLAGELAELIPDLPCKKVLVHRDLNPSYVAHARLEEFARNYDLLLLPGETGPLGQHPSARLTPPWLLRDSADIVSRDAALERLGIAPTQLPIIVVLGTGKPIEVDAMRALAARLSSAIATDAVVRCVTPRAETSTDVSLWPLLSAIRGVDLLVGAGGYNTVWEARTTRTPLVAIARKRLYDRQPARLSTEERVADEEAAYVRVTELLRSGSIVPRSGVPHYANGVHEAIRLIEAI